MSDRVLAMEAFVRVVESGSFSAAGRSSGLTQSAVSKAVAGLEQRLGARLLNRTTRSVSPTPVGAAYFERCKQVLAEIGEAEREARFGQVALHGRLRINTSAMLALSLVQPALIAFAAEHPQVAPELVMDDRRIDPVEEGADLIIRSGALGESTLVYRRAGSSPTIVCASPGYLRGAPPLDRLQDLSAHPVIGFTDRVGAATRFEVQDASGAPSEVTIQSPLAVSSAVLAREAVLAGIGICVFARFVVEADLLEGRLVQVMADLKLPRSEVSILHPFGRRPPARVSAFIDFAVARGRSAGTLAS